MNISAILRTTEYRGDHSADISRAYELIAGETVEALAERILTTPNDWIEVRLIKESELICTCDLSSLDPSESCLKHGAG